MYLDQLQTMSKAFSEICQGERPWTALGNFMNAWYGYAKDIRDELVSEPLTRPAKVTEHTHRWGAFYAASVEFLCERYAVPCPMWVHDPWYTLTEPWYGNERDITRPSVRQHRIQTTQPSFARRNVFHGSRLFQNKYEMSAWIQEAKALGITDPDEILRYAHTKEVSIHGG